MTISIVYDLDGTLVDSVSNFINSYQIALDGNLCSQELKALFADVIGQNEVGVFKKILGDDWHIGLSIFNKLEDANLQKVRVFDGIIRMVEDFKKLTVKQYVVTGKSQRNAEKILEKTRLISYFDAVYYGTEDNCSKALNLKSAIKRFSLDREQVWYLGDTRGDYDAALEAGVVPAICNWGDRNEALDYSFPPNTNIFDTVDAFSKMIISTIHKDTPPE